MTTGHLTSTSVYTVLKSTTLSAMYRDGRQGQFTEHKKWVTAKQLLAEANRNGDIVPVIFALAEAIRELVYWAELAAVHIYTDEEGNDCTRVNIRNLTRIKPPRPKKTQLTVLSTGSKLPRNHIRPYVIVQTPAFLVKHQTQAAVQLSGNGIAVARRARRTHPIPEKSCDGRLTVFSWGYHGWGNSVDQLLEAVEAAEAARGYKPPVFVDVRIRRSVRAEGFRDHTFEKQLESSRHFWLRGLGNQAIVDGGEMRLADPTEIQLLLKIVTDAAGDMRRVIFFCSCRYAKWKGQTNCHRQLVGTLLLKAARRAGSAMDVVDWPGGTPARLLLSLAEPDFQSVRRGKMTIPLPKRCDLAQFAAVPWGSIAHITSGSDSLERLVGPAVWTQGKWQLPVMPCRGDGECSFKDPGREATLARKWYGFDARRS